MTSNCSLLRGAVAATLIATLVFPAPLAMAAANPAPTLKDVRLDEGGQLTTRIVDGQGQPVAGAEVSVRYRQQAVAHTVTDENGYAKFSGLRSGPHTIVSPASEKDVRLWTSDTAPPNASRVSVVVSDLSVLRGQFGGFNLPMITVVGGTIAALVVALDAQNDADNANAAAKNALQQIADLQEQLDEHQHTSP